MSWTRKRDICLLILEELLEECKQQDNHILYDPDIVNLYIKDIKKEFKSKNFLNKNEEQKEIDALGMLNGVLGFSNDTISKIYLSKCDDPHTYMTLEEAKKKLIEEYFNSIKNGNDSISEITISDWMADNQIIIIDKEKEKSSSEIE